MQGIETVRALLFDDDKRFLMIKRSPQDSEPGLWCLPGGKKDKKDEESIDDAVVRELWEEVGLSLVLHYSLQYKINQEEINGSAVYLATYVVGKIIDDAKNKVKVDEKEAVAYKWVNMWEAVSDGNLAFSNGEGLLRILRKMVVMGDPDTTPFAQAKLYKLPADSPANGKQSSRS